MRKAAIVMQTGIFRRWAIVVLFFLLLMPQTVSALPKPLSDEELDGVVAQGSNFTMYLTPDQQFVQFGFDTGSMFGNGSVGATSSTAAPSTMVINGASVNLNQSTFFAQNLILNLNVCMSCKATTIVQQGFGFPITVNVQP